jgi:hypothetical protein
MRLGLYIAFLIGLSTAVFGQVVVPTGVAEVGQVFESGQWDGKPAVVTDNQKDRFEIRVWNGDFWNALPSINVLPKVNETAGRNFRIVGLIEYQDQLFVAASVGADLSPDSRNYLVRWNGTLWEDVSTQMIRNALDLSDIQVYQDNLILLGTFNGPSGTSNILSFNSMTNNWSQSGSPLVNESDEYFNSADVFDEKLIVTGSFNVSSSNSTRSMAFWDGSKWEYSTLPAFLGKSESVSVADGDLFVSGYNLDGSYGIKRYSGGAWEDMSAGLDQLSRANLKRVTKVQEQWVACGSFDLDQDRTSAILTWTGNEWKSSEVLIRKGNKSKLIPFENEVFLASSAPFVLEDADQTYIGKVYLDKATVTGRVFIDYNGNCLRDSDEPWMKQVPVQLKEDQVPFYTNDNGYFMVIADPGQQYRLNVVAPQYWQLTCTDESVNLVDSKNYAIGGIGIRPISGAADLNVEIVNPAGFGVKDQQKNEVYLLVSNPGTEVLSETEVKLMFGSSFTNLQSVPAFDQNIGNEATWKLTDIEPGEKRWIKCYFDVNGSTDLSLELNGAIEGGFIDRDLSNNEQKETFSLDSDKPIAKYDLNRGVLFEASEKASYRITVRNETATPIHSIVVVDELDHQFFISKEGVSFNTPFDVKTKVDYEFIPENENYAYTFSWAFENINLPQDSTLTLDLNINLAPGYLESGKLVCNQARVYFANETGIYTEGVLTDNVCALVDDGLGIQTHVDEQMNEIRVYPNPVNEELHLIGLEVDQPYVIYNLIGEEILSGQTTDGSLSVGNLKSGYYLLQVEGYTALKVLINH